MLQLTEALNVSAANVHILCPNPAFGITQYPILHFIFGLNQNNSLEGFHQASQNFTDTNEFVCGIEIGGKRSVWRARWVRDFILCRGKDLLLIILLQRAFCIRAMKKTISPCVLRGKEHGVQMLFPKTSRTQLASKTLQVNSRWHLLSTQERTPH